MRKIKIVADSSANLLSLPNTAFASAPLKMITDEREFVDNAQLDVSAMLDYFSQYKGKSKTSCPNPGDWVDAMGDADDVFCVAITSGLSGSYNAACVAKQMYEADLCTVYASLAGYPAISVPFGKDGNGLPLAVQLIAPPMCEERLLATAKALEEGMA